MTNGRADVPFIRFRFENDAYDLADAEAYVRKSGQPWVPAGNAPNVQPKSVRVIQPTPVSQVNQTQLRVQVTRNETELLGVFDVSASFALNEADVKLSGMGEAWQVRIICISMDGDEEYFFFPI